jgi:16S rRNA (adenine1518-N6/adenine1519-N6)-dimethyltransferase
MVALFYTESVAQTKQQIQQLLDQARTEPRKRFGQNFMIDPNTVRLVADAGMISPDDVVIEVGPGTGTLTEELLGRARKVVAVEIDRDLARMLRDQFGANPAFELIEGDALEGKHGVNPAVRAICAEAKLVANLPYNIASPLIIEMLIAGAKLLAFTVQKEVADRLRASSEDDAYGPLSVMVQLLAKVEVLRTISPKVFWPAPKIESALVRLTREDQLGARAVDFSRFLHGVFGFRRKTLRKAMAESGNDPAILQKLGIDPQLRPENLTPKRWLELFDAAGG